MSAPPKKAGRPPRQPGNARTVMLRVSPADMTRWAALATERGYADVYDMLCVAVEQLDPDDMEGQLADLGRAAVALAEQVSGRRG